VRTLHKEGYWNAVCCVCGKLVHRKPHEINTIKNIHCSRKCFAEGQKEHMSGKNNHQYGLKGEKNASWKGGKKKSSYGYILVWKPDHPFANGDGNVFEHRLIAEKYLLTKENSVEVNGERYLSPKYDVHHVNEDKTDNSVNNLVVLTKGEHKRLHNLKNMQYMIRDRKGRIARIGKANDQKVCIRLNKNAKKPTVATKYSAGYDLYCAEEKEVTVNPGETYLFETGLAIELPECTFGAVYSRSGLSTKKSMMLVNGVGIIDQDYRNTIKVPLRNFGKEPQTIKPNDRIAQLVIQRYEQVELVEVDELTYTERGAGGFGSTGR
jgi:dUTP pyrophosphatase